VLGIPGRGAADGFPAQDPDAPRHAWLVLNDHSRSRTLRQLGSFKSYDLDCRYVDGLRRKVPDLDDYVLRHLRTLCR
jgi:hypothetical protein